MPGRGYWAKKRAGKRASRRGLPKGLDPDEVVLHYAPLDEPDLEPEPRREPPSPPTLDKDLHQVRAAIEAAGPMPAPDDLSTVHPVVARSRRALRRAAATGVRGHYHNHGLLCPDADGSMLSVQVSEASIDRAMRFFEGLLRAAIGLGARVIQKDSVALLRFCGEEALFDLRHPAGSPSPRTPFRTNSEEPIPRGVLACLAHLEMVRTSVVVRPRKWGRGQAACT